MSEREIRTQAENIFSCFLEPGYDPSPFEDVRVYPGEFKALARALSKEPDLVVLLRWLARGWRRVPKGSETGTTFETVIDRINETVRLTDDGWKWVED